MPFSHKLAEVRAQLVAHPLYHSINDADSLRTFMRAHVFCVWDFQSILKALQGRLTTVTIPWLPTADAEARRLINEIVLEEESDIHPDGGYCSHYEFYLQAMKDNGADMKPIKDFISRLEYGGEIREVIEASILPAGVNDFLHNTFDAILDQPLHCQVALFAYSREDMIPDMFIKLVEHLKDTDTGKWQKFHYYLNRHIEIDGERHGPIAQALLERICQDDKLKWQQSERTIIRALQARINLWDCILQEIQVDDLVAIQ